MVKRRVMAGWVISAVVAGVQMCTAAQVTAPARGAAAGAQAPTRVTTQPNRATAPAVGADALLVTVTGIQGLVQVRTEEGKDWVPAKLGMQLNEGAEFRTGPRSAVRFVIPPDQTITLDRLGTMKVLEAIEQQGKVTTDLGMKYGRARYDIEKVGVEHASTIRSPGSTLAIRGTDVTYEDQAPWVPNASSIEGRAEFRDFKRQYLAFGGNTKAEVRADKSSVAGTAADKTKSDPKGAFSGRTETEDLLLGTLPSQGGVDARGLRAINELARSGFSGTFVGAPPVDGPLSFELQWQPVNLSAPGATDLDLVVRDPKGNVASKNHLTVGSGTSEGIHSGNDVGSSGSGIERVQWSAFFPAGQYKVEINHISGSAAQAFLLVTRKETIDLKILGTDPASPLILRPGDKFTTTVNVTGSTSSSSPEGAQARRKR
jgi:hypothetical protein